MRDYLLIKDGAWNKHQVVTSRDEGNRKLKALLSEVIRKPHQNIVALSPLQSAV